jgi:hypothetical protein
MTGALVGFESLYLGAVLWQAWRRRWRDECWMRHVAATVGILAIALLAGCVRHVRTHQTLTDVLRLETNIRPADLQSGARVRASFFLRNIATTPVHLCELDSGVSVSAITARGLFPRLGYGSWLDKAPVCYRLRPGEAKAFVEEFTWSATLGGERAEQLQGSIRVYARGGDAVSITSAPVSAGQ